MTDNAHVATTLDDLRLAWAALGQAPDRRGRSIATLALAETVSEGPILLALDVNGNRHLLVPVGASAPSREDRASDAVVIVDREIGVGADRRRFTDVECGQEELVDVLDDLILAMLRAISTAPDDPTARCLEVLDTWREMLRPPPREPLGISQAAALVAELQVAIDLLGRDASRRLDVWTGPAGGRHDFRRGPYALEVKATLAQTGRIAAVHGLEQLAAPTEGTLHLAWFRLEQVPDGGLSVLELAARLRELVGGTRELHLRLMEAGWQPGTAADSLRFEVREQLLYTVDAGFPRIVPSSFPSGAAPIGVSDVRYSVDLDAVPAGPLSPPDADNCLERLANHAGDGR